MGNNVLVFLSFLDWEKPICETSSETTLLVLLVISSLFWREVSVDTHESSDSSNIFISVESSNEVDDTFVFWFGSDVKQDYELGIKVSAESLEEPEMRGKFGSIEMFEATEEFESFGVVIVDFFWIGQSGMP